MFSSTVHEQAAAPYHLGPLPDADAVGQQGIPGQGPYLQVFLKLEGDCITRASYQTYSCPVAIACGSWLVNWLEGKTVEQAGIIAAADLMRVLGGLPLGKEHCASLAVDALKSALQQWQTRGEEIGEPL
jgi:nitrogen fixation NifU-like protein